MKLEKRGAPATGRQAVRHLTQQHGMSEPRACKATGFSRMSMRYQAQCRDEGVLWERA